MDSGSFIHQGSACRGTCESPPEWESTMLVLSTTDRYRRPLAQPAVARTGRKAVVLSAEPMVITFSELLR
jgi:hypothetical protein